jgi:hypothetical protein
MAASSPTVFKGDVSIIPGIDPVIYGPGNLSVANNLTVSGDSTTLDTEQTTIKDNAVALNKGAAIIGNDIGTWGERNPVDVVSDTPDVTGTSQGPGTLTTIILANTESAVDDFYNGWIIEITAGTSSGDIRTISDYTGASRTATVSADWTIAPDATSQYALHSGAATVNIYDESADEYALAYTADPHTNKTFNITKYADLHVNNLQVDGMINGDIVGRVAYRLIENVVSVHNLANYISVAELPWSFARYSGYSSAVIVAYIVISGANLDLRIYDTISASVIAGPFVINATQVVTIGIPNANLPGVDAALQLQVRKSAAGVNPKIRGATAEFKA